jgi:hypothetical protein
MELADELETVGYASYTGRVWNFQTQSQVNARRYKIQAIPPISLCSKYTDDDLGLQVGADLPKPQSSPGRTIRIGPK